RDWSSDVCSSDLMRQVRLDSRRHEMKLLVEKLWVRILLSLLTLAIVWELMARFGILNPFYAPPPSEILRVVYSLFAEGRILSHLEATFTAALVGLVIGVALGIVCGFAAA